MSLFKRRKDNVDTIDFTELQKRGILERATSMSNNQIKENSNSMPSMENNFGSSDMFSALDSLASTNTTGSELTSNSNNLTGLTEPELNALKVKVEDLEYKLERLLEKLELIEGKLGS